MTFGVGRKVTRFNPRRVGRIFDRNCPAPVEVAEEDNDLDDFDDGIVDDNEGDDETIVIAP